MGIYDYEKRQMTEAEEGIRKCLRDKYGIEKGKIVKLLDDYEFVRMERRYVVQKGSFGVINGVSINDINDTGTIKCNLNIYCHSAEIEVPIRIKSFDNSTIVEDTGKELGNLINLLDDSSEITQAIHEYEQSCDKYNKAKSKYNDSFLNIAVTCLGVAIAIVVSTLIEMKLFQYFSPGVHLVAYTDFLDIVFGIITLPIVLIFVGGITFSIINALSLSYDETVSGKKLRKAINDAVEKLKELDKKYCA